jgi:fructokinase
VIIVAGEALIDLISDPGGRLVAKPGGGPYNTARTIGRLGQGCAFLGRISVDRFGDQLLGNLRGDSVDVGLVERTSDPTTLAVAEIDEAGGATYRFYAEGTAAPGLSGAHVLGSVGQDAAAVHVGTLGLVLQPMARAIERLVESLGPGPLVMVDPNCRPSATRDRSGLVSRVERIAARTDVIKVSVDDARFLYPDLPVEAATSRLRSLGASVVLLTDGGRSVRVATDRGDFTLDVPRVDVVDTVGAGDAFGGGFLASWIGRGLGREELQDPTLVRDSVAFAVLVASETCRRAGADPPTMARLAALVGGDPLPLHG